MWPYWQPLDSCLFCACQCLVSNSSLKINIRINTEVVPLLHMHAAPTCTIPPATSSLSFKAQLSWQESFCLCADPHKSSQACKEVVTDNPAAAWVLYPVCSKAIGVGLLWGASSPVFRCSLKHVPSLYIICGTLSFVIFFSSAYFLLGNTVLFSYPVLTYAFTHCFFSFFSRQTSKQTTSRTSKPPTLNPFSFVNDQRSLRCKITFLCLIMPSQVAKCNAVVTPPGP